MSASVCEDAQQLTGLTQFMAADVAQNGSTVEEETAEAESPPRKRIKVTTVVATGEDLRRRAMEHKLLRAKAIRDRATEQLCELYFLQAGGNMMDYVAWRKRAPAPQLRAFLEQRRLPPLESAPPATTVSAPPTSPPPVPPPTLPPIAPAPTPTQNGDITTSAQNTQEEIVEKAKQEAYVARRVAALARAGLWAERRLPRVLEPPRNKSHWDYFLEEMAWLAQDFAYERKWKKQAAKKCARMVQKHFQDKALAATRAERALEQQLRRVAAFAAREIRAFWNNIEKLAEWKRSRRLQAVRKEALDEQLNYIVDRTEHYSRQLAATLNDTTTVATPQPHRMPSDDEFSPESGSSDDEETIAAAEREGPGMEDTGAEVEALQRESALDLDDVLRALPPGYLQHASPPPSASPRSDYSADSDSADDETTIAEQEQTQPHDADELSELQADAELSVDELMRRYNHPHSDIEADEEDDENDMDVQLDDSTSESEGRASPRLSALVESACAADDTALVRESALLAAALQPTGNTLSETSVGTLVPHLLKHSLREYQHVGLHWLATLHERRLNGILADEMGLGKTIQTIALLAHLALERCDWGPHLVVAPTSVVLNWEMEFKKWCPAFKILTYYGTIKERKAKRVGWTKPNSFHICITSYKLVVQDHQSFRRKRWKYLILDEAQNIKNFKSQRWQMLLNFQTDRRLLLTGTPLQNSLLELWSLMHFLMPAVFASHSEFREWFAPVAAADDSGAANDHLVRRLHQLLRPFLLRRLKADVERQMPKKYDHVLLCRLSKRQRCLYDDFMSRARTRDTLASGNLLSVINVLMQLRKVCNHPDLFEPRGVQSPLQMEGLRMQVPALVLVAAVAERVAIAGALGGQLAALEAAGAMAFPSHRARHLAPPRRLLEELPRSPPIAPPTPPAARIRLHMRLVPRVPPQTLTAPPPLPAPPQTLTTTTPPPPPEPTPPESLSASDPATTSWWRVRGLWSARRRARLRRLASTNDRRCWRLPLYGADLRAVVIAGPLPGHSSHAPTLEERLQEARELQDRYGMCVGGARAPCPLLDISAGAAAWRSSAMRVEEAACDAARPLLLLTTHTDILAPHPRLLQYDCGKLQTLDVLLRRLKTGGHRVLIFTQMTRVLDVLEAFLCMHGHTYLRLDGATRVDHRQILVDRFNNDIRLFAFILSTRSGGVGLNLTGADTVIFYDSDWNPTMDAQAQDRAHRIGQTRDVHVYRLVSSGTVEENILRKAEQKRALGHRAIEEGRFTTASLLRADAIRDLLGAAKPDTPTTSDDVESALAAAEDEADAAAARAAATEQQREAAEFDENAPIAAATPAVEQEEERDPEMLALMEQLTPIEKYAMRLVENSEAASEAERAAREDMLRQRREWQTARDNIGAADDSSTTTMDELTYSGQDARTQMWVSVCGYQRMPVWSPPTPPGSEGDVYVERWARVLYRAGAAPEALLPGSPRPHARPHARARRPAPRALPPPGLFERATARPRPRPPRASPAAHPLPPPADWSAHEDAALRRALRLQRLPAGPPPSPAATPAAHQPNWEWAADLALELGPYRTARSCRERHESAPLPQPLPEPRKQKKAGRARRAGSGGSRARVPLSRLEAMREALERRREAPKRRCSSPQAHNPKHAAILHEYGVELEAPLSPMDVAARRADRIAKEKLKQAAPTSAASSPSQPQTQRIVVAAHPVAAVVKGGAGVGAAHLAVYRQQTLARQQQLKILQQAQAASGGTSDAAVGAAVEAAGVRVAAGGQLRALQLQQLAVARARAAPVTAPTAAPRPRPPHVLLAHLQPQHHHNNDRQ